MTKPKRIRYEVVFVDRDDSRNAVRILVDAVSVAEAIEYARIEAPDGWVALQVFPKGQRLF